MIKRTLTEDINTVLGLADQELQSLYQCAKRDDDNEVKMQADTAAKALQRVTPLLFAAPELIEILKELFPPTGTSGISAAQIGRIYTAIAQAEGTAHAQ